MEYCMETVTIEVETVDTYMQTTTKISQTKFDVCQ